MRIVHISDLHWRCLKYHRDYRVVFDDLYKKIEELKPDLVINTGDTVHQKTNLSPELVEMVSWMHREIAKRSELDEILGNHDLNLMNSDRQDAITPIVQSINDPNIRLHKNSGLAWSREFDCGKINLWIFGIGDQENYPRPEDWAKYPDDINIGLFHGSVLNCVTDSNWRMTHTEREIGLFEGLDYVLMGDIHKQQFMDSDRRIGYAGSLIQQNFGEDVEKGFLVWDIESKKKHDVFPVYLKGSRPFITIDLNEDKTLPKIDIPRDARIRIRPKGPMTLIEQKAIERQVKKKYSPHDVITLSVVNIGQSRSAIGKDDIAHENLRSLEVQERLLRRFLAEKGLSEKVFSKIMDLNRKYQVEIEQIDDQARNVFWKVRKIVWSNLFNYGENNHIDFSALSGLTGIFAPNASGKSNMIDILMQTLFDSTTKGISKNVFLINDNKDQAVAISEITAENREYILERSIERIKYGQRSGPTKEWGKTSVNFYGVGSDGVKDNLNGVSRPETERTIRKRVGSFDDFMLSNLFAQWNPSDIIQCKESERKRILYKFLDLDIFGQKGEMGKIEAREHYDRLRDLEDTGIREELTKCSSRMEDITKDIGQLEQKLGEVRDLNSLCEEKILSLSAQKVKVDCNVDPDDESGRRDNSLESLERMKGDRAKKTAELLDRQARLLEISDPDDIDELRLASDRSLELRQELVVLERSIDKISQTLALHKKKLPLLDEVPCGDEYPGCKFLVDAFASKKKIPSWQRELDDLRNQERLSRDELSVVEPISKRYVEEIQKIQKRKDISSEIGNIRLQLENLKLKVIAEEERYRKATEELERFAQAEQDIRQNEVIDSKISFLKSERSKIVEAEKKIIDCLADLHSEKGGQITILSRLQEQQEQLSELRDICTAFEHYAAAMGKDGIAFEILKQKLPLINDEINKILGSCADFSVYVEYSEEEESIRIYIQYEEYKQRLIELGSGAEKFLSSIALRNALLNISNLPKTNLFIIDEGFGKLDPKNMENINRMFDYLRTVFEHIIVISHSDIMKDFVDNMIDITTDDEGYAHVCVG